ncbi:MAG: hypothetical protein ACI4NZ_00805 [Candidatus Enterousia sp.]
MLNFTVRENMKSLSRFLMFALALISVGAHASPVATTVGSNLTAYNPGFGATNNNNWNILTNPRSGAESAPVADFGNCNALILRCAQPKCASGGCTDMDVTSEIVTGCVNSNDTCKQYGADLVKYISAQLVAQSTAKANQAATAAQNAAAQQNNQQMQAMQQQMAALQQQIAESNANMQAALDAQQQSTAQAIADATANVSKSSSAGGANSASAPETSNIDTTELTTTQRIAVESGVPEDLLLREQISGEILSKIEDAEKNLNTLKQTMNLAFEYAGCDSRGDNCTGPKRVKKFKDLAGEFFDPYEDVLDDLYEAILLSQSVGVDVSNIYMMLNNSCERWAKYSCSKPMTVVDDPNSNNKLYVWPRYNSNNCKNGKSIAGAPIGASNNANNIISYNTGSVRGGMECNIGQTIPPEDDTSCTMIEVLSGDSANDVARGYLYPDEGDMGDMVRVGCASNALKSSWLFRGKKQQASINIDTLRRIIEQDNAQISFTSRSDNDLKQNEQLKYCALTESGYMNLQKYVGLRGLPTTGICINERSLNKNLDRVYVGRSDTVIEKAFQECKKRYPTGTSDNAVAFSKVLYKCYCYDNTSKLVSSECDTNTSRTAMYNAEERYCDQYGGAWVGVQCDCTHAPYPEDRALCESRFNRPSGNFREVLPQSCDVINGSGDAICCRDRGGDWDAASGKCKCDNTIMSRYDKCDSDSYLMNHYILN